MSLILRASVRIALYSHEGPPMVAHGHIWLPYVLLKWLLCMLRPFSSPPHLSASNGRDSRSCADNGRDGGRGRGQRSRYALRRAATGWQLCEIHPPGSSRARQGRGGSLHDWSGAPEPAQQVKNARDRPRGRLNGRSATVQCLLCLRLLVAWQTAHRLGARGYYSVLNLDHGTLV